MRATTGNSGAKALRERLKKPEILIAPGAYDCISARLIEQMGFEAAFMTGFGASGSILGQPDYGLMTMNEMAAVCANMNYFLNIPLIGDIDTGYGNPLNVYRTVREFERAGMAAVHLEDQVFPKRCGHMEKKAVIPMEEHVEKIRAAVEARDEMMIIARTDAFATHGLDETLRRLEAYRDAAFAAARAIENYLQSLKKNRSNAEIIASGTVPSFAQFNSIVGMETLTDMERRFQVDVFKKKHSEEQK